ncbi:MAG: PEP-CTERM sorting domain-containing protein [Candidatus Acidiferrum sp.]
MLFPIRRLGLILGAFLLLGGASSAYADSFQLTFTSGLTGVLDLTATAQGGGSFLVTSVTGTENGLAVGTLIAPNSSGLYTVPDGDGFTYDDLLFPTSSTVFDNDGLLFTLAGSSGSIFENLYSVGTASYLESAYLANGAAFPADFSYVPVTFTLVDTGSSNVATPEPSTLILSLLGLLSVGLATLTKKLII